MKTKDEIIKELLFSDKYINEDLFTEDFLLDAMDQWAKETAIDFKKWIKDKELIEGSDGFWYEQPKYIHETFGLVVAISYDKLFDLYQQETGSFK